MVFGLWILHNCGWNLHNWFIDGLSDSRVPTIHSLSSRSAPMWQNVTAQLLQILAAKSWKWHNIRELQAAEFGLNSVQQRLYPTMKTCTKWFLIRFRELQWQAKRMSFLEPIFGPRWHCCSYLLSKRRSFQQPSTPHFPEASPVD